jgi:MFS family permease
MADSPRKGSLLVIFLAVFIDLLGFGMVLPLLPVYAKDFGQGLSEQQIGWMIGLLMSSFSAMQFLAAPLWGRLSDRIGRRPVLMVGLAGSVIFYALFGYATATKSLLWLFVSRVGAGLAGATISTAHAYIADTTTLQTRARGMALIGAAFGLGFTGGPLFGFLALLSNPENPGPAPGYAAAGLSTLALLLAYFLLPESLVPHRTIERRKWLDLGLLTNTLATPSVGLLLVTSFMCVFAFANFESTLSLMLRDERGPFELSYPHMLLVFAYIGLVLTIVQGGLVRRLSGRVSEVKLALVGIAVEIVGFFWLPQVIRAGLFFGRGSLIELLLVLGLLVSGFAFVTPSLNSLISRRSDPARQGGILGLAQGISSLARIIGPIFGARLFLSADASRPYLLGGATMALALVLVLIAGKAGQDYPAEVASQSE